MRIVHAQMPTVQTVLTVLTVCADGADSADDADGADDADSDYDGAGGNHSRDDNRRRAMKRCRTKTVSHTITAIWR